MADYKLTETTTVLRTADQVWIPDDPDNRDRIEYEKWLAAGNTPDPAPPLPPLPPAAKDANARLDAGIAAAYDVAVAVKAAMQATPNVMSAANFTAAMIQLDALSVAFVEMLQAQKTPP